MIWKAGGDRIVVQIEEAPKQTETGIILPDKLKSAKVQTGTILARGPEASGLAVGDRVYFEERFSIEIEPNVRSVELPSVLAAVRAE